MPQSFENARGAVLELPRGLRVSGFDRPAVVTLARGGLGHEVVRRTLDPARGSLEGVLTGRSYVEAQAKLDALLAFLHHQPLRFRRHALTDPYLEVWTEGLADDGTTVGKAAQVRVPLVAPDPLRVGDPQGYPGGGAYQDLPGAPYTFAITNVGNAPAPLTVYMRAPASGVAHLPMIENLTTGQSARYNAALLAGQELVVDGRAHAAVVEEGTRQTVVTDLMSNAFLVGGLHLAPGENSLRVTMSASGAWFRLAYTARYY